MSIYFEADKMDADLLDKYGKDTRNLRKGSHIQKGELSSPIYSEKDNSDRKKNIRTALRDEGALVPKYGANPNASKDADKKQIKKFKQSMRSKYDADKTASNFQNPTAQRIVKDRIEKGKELPDDMKDKMVKKPKITENRKEKHAFIECKFEENDKNFEEVKRIVANMKTTNDYFEYTKLYRKFVQLTTSSNDTDFATITHLHISGNNVEYVGVNSITAEENFGNIFQDETFYHVSNKSGIKELYPTFRSKDGVFFKTPRVYFTFGVFRGRMDDGMSSSDYLYTPIGSLGKIYADQEGVKNSVYVETTTPIKVKQFTTEELENEKIKSKGYHTREREKIKKGNQDSVDEFKDKMKDKYKK